MALDQADIEEYEWKDGELQLKEDKEMSFLDHLEELRWHIIRSLVAILVGTIVLFVFTIGILIRLFWGHLKTILWLTTGFANCRKA